MSTPLRLQSLKVLHLLTRRTLWKYPIIWIQESRRFEYYPSRRYTKILFLAGECFTVLVTKRCCSFVLLKQVLCPVLFISTAHLFVFLSTLLGSILPAYASMLVHLNYRDFVVFQREDLKTESFQIYKETKTWFRGIYPAHCSMFYFSSNVHCSNCCLT